jgi:hypothetical protein
MNLVDGCFVRSQIIRRSYTIVHTGSSPACSRALRSPKYSLQHSYCTNSKTSSDAWGTRHRLALRSEHRDMRHNVTYVCCLVQLEEVLVILLHRDVVGNVVEVCFHGGSLVICMSASFGKIVNNNGLEICMTWLQMWPDFGPARWSWQWNRFGPIRADICPYRVVL